MPEIDSTEPTDDTADVTSEPAEGDLDFWRTKAGEWEKRAKGNSRRIKELEPKASQFDALEAASKSELERAQEQTTALQAQLETTQRQALVASVALDKGLPANLARRLQGDSREDLEADADELLAQFPPSDNGPRRPAPDRSQGSSATPSTTDPAQQFASIIRSQIGS
jgi:hypothetical protein